MPANAPAETAALGEAVAAEHDAVPAVTPSLPTFVSNVAAVTDLSPNVREVVLTGGLDDFVPAGGDQFVYLMVQRVGHPELPADHTMADQMARAPGTGPLGAYYTVRSWDCSRRCITLWIVRHGHGVGVGAWVERATVGERVAVWGPRPGVGVLASAPSALLVADESGLAAVAALLEEAPAHRPTTVLVETNDAEHVVALPERDGAAVHWLFRGADPPGTGSRLLDAVRRLDVVADELVAFGAAESRQVSAMRAYLRRERGMAPSRVAMTGYWRRVTE